MPSQIEAALVELAAGRSLSASTLSDVMDEVFSDQASDAQIRQLLVLLHEKGEGVEELAGAAMALRRRMTIVRCGRAAVIDTCGTGGGGLGLFNISTAAAIVAVAAGAVVAKHGNRAVTSRSGSADVLAALGVDVAAPLEVVEQCLNEIGLCFCFAQLMHPSVKRVAEIRRQLPFPTIFNLTGPLCNPAQAQYQLIGAGRGSTQSLLANALARLGTVRSIVVHGSDGLGEVTVSGATRGQLVGPEGVIDLTWTPQEFGLDASELAELRVRSPAESAAHIRAVLRGERGVARDIVVANAAAALWIAGHQNTLSAAVRECQQAIDDGRAANVLARLVRITNQTTR